MFDFKNATPEERSAEFKRLAVEIGGDHQFGVGKELAYLPEILMDSEQVIALCRGLMNRTTWLITLTDRRIIFLDKGMLWGLKQSIIDLDKVNSVSCTTGVVFGKIMIEDGASTRVIDKVLKKVVVPFSNKVRDAQEARKARHYQPAPAAAVAPVEDDVFAKLEKLAALLERKVLTQEEFDAKKAQLLS